MGYCIFCEKNKTENWFGSFCKDCRKIKNLGNVYGFARTLDILEKCCIRNPNQLENKIMLQKKVVESECDESYEKPITRNASK